jgi:hypothetical protein
MISDTSTLVVFIDVDDTFVRSVGKKRIPIVSVVKHIKKLHQQGAVIYCWSSGGEKYAHQSAEEFGIASCFSGFLPKPNLLIDDQTVSEWRNCIEVHPSGIQDEGLTGYINSIKNKTII